jgi:hypothetical protein
MLDLRPTEAIEVFYNPEDAKIHHALELAIEYASVGWYVFPCKPDKRPHTRHGMKDASLNQEEIRNWWNQWPSALIGIACERSGLFALDIDVDPTKGINGFDSLAELIETAGNGQPLFPMVGPVQSTPRGGQHYLFELPSDIQIPNNVGKLGLGLDLRSNGYICTGAGYKWLFGHGPQTPLTPAPQWLLDQISKLIKTPINVSQNFQAGINEPSYIEVGNLWLKRALSMAVEGNRNDIGFWLGCQLRDSGVPQHEAEQLLRLYAKSVPGDGYTEMEALASIDSAYSMQPREPARRIGERYPINILSNNLLQNYSQSPHAKTRWTVAELLDANLPEPKWAIPGLIPEGLTILGGRPKVGKSWLALQMAHSISTGSIFFGHRVELGNVLYIALEDGSRRLQERLRKHGIPRDAMITFERNWEPLQGEGLGYLSREISEHAYRLVIVDTLTRAFRGLDQNDQPIINAVMSNLQRMCQDYHLAMVFIDHTNKPKGFLSDPVDSIMNSTVKTAVADQVLALYKEQGKAIANLKGRGRDTEEIDLLLSWDPTTCCWQYEGETGQIRITEERKEILDALDVLGKSQANKVAQYLGKDRSNIRRKLNELYNQQLVRREAIEGKVFYEKA